MKIFSSPLYKAFLHQNKCYIANIEGDKIIRIIECGSELLMGLFPGNGSTIVLTTFQKTLEVFSIEDGKQLASVKLEKKCSAMLTRFYNETEYLIIGDKVGDILALDLPNLSKKTLLGGHCATVITDLKNIGNYIASSDRDEKVYICHFPQTFNIQSICVCHTQFVSCIETIQHHLLSGSADVMIRLFNVETGECKMDWNLFQLLSIENDDEAIIIPLQLFAVDNSHFLCIVDNFAKVLVLSIEDPSFVVSVELDDLPVAITKDVEKICIFTRSVKSFELNCKEWKVQEMDIPVMKLLKEMNYIYEKSSEEQESGELFKQTVKNKLTTSLGLEKQYEHINNKMMKRQ